jgi:hypothetical protein
MPTRTALDLLGTITLDNPSLTRDLASALAAGGCTVAREDPRTLSFKFPWGTPQSGGTLTHAWNEVVFFLRAWELTHPEVECRVSDVRFRPSGDRLSDRYAAA